jgi:hypothetical protein
MNNDEKLRIKNALMVCAELFNRNLSEGVLEIYISSLKEYPIDNVLHALKSCTQEISYMPTIADILKKVKNKTDIHVMAELAWSYVLDVIDVCGIYESFTFKDKAIRKAISLIDYDVELCMCNRAETHWKKRDFIESYKVFAESNGNYDAPNYFSGTIEINNEKWGNFKGKIYVAELKQFVEQENLIKTIDGYKPKLSLVDKKPKNKIAR